LTCGLKPAGEEVTLLSSIVASFVPTLLLVFLAVVVWRLVSHRRAIQSTLRYGVEVIPSWVLWLAAIVCTAIATLWIVVLLAM